MTERMFDEHSFQEEIAGKAEAKAGVLYLAGNETNFRRTLQAENLSFEDVEKEVSTVWGNLLKACQKVGYNDAITAHKAKQFNMSLPKIDM
jgi:hypothetical protein